MVNQAVKVVNPLHFAHEIKICLIEPLEIFAVNSKRKGFVFGDGAVLDLVHLVELSLKKDEIFSSF